MYAGGQIHFWIRIWSWRGIGFNNGSVCVPDFRQPTLSITTSGHHDSLWPSSKYMAATKDGDHHLWPPQQINSVFGLPLPSRFPECMSKCVTFLESTGHRQVYETLYSREYHKKSSGNKSLPTSTGTKCQPLFISGVGQAPYKSTQISTISGV